MKIKQTLVWRGARRLHRELKDLDCWLSVRSNAEVVVSAIYGGIGDELLCSSFFEEVYRRRGKKICLITTVPELFANNPRIGSVLKMENRFIQFCHRWNKEILRPAEWQSNHPDDKDQQSLPKRHIIAELNHKGGVRGDVKIKPYVYLTPAEMAGGRLVDRQVAIMSSGLAARIPFKNKAWYPERFQGVVTSLSSEYNFVQLGVLSDPPLEGAIDLRGKCSLREAASILFNSQFFIGQVGFLMHLARAVDCRSVIVFGGREAPHQSGYGCNENLYTPLSCAPCWKENKCDYDRECMRVILVDHVIEAVSRIVSRKDNPIEEDVVTLND